MEHRTALALAGAVVMVGGSGAVAVGTLTGAIGPDTEHLPVVGPPATVGPGTADRRPAAGGGPRVERVTRFVDVPVPAPAAPADGDAAEETADLAEEQREERAERLEERREEYAEVLEERREERQDRLEDLADDDNSGSGGGDSGSGGSGHG